METLRCRQRALGQALVGQRAKRYRVLFSVTDTHNVTFSLGSCSKSPPPQPPLQSTNGPQLEQGGREQKVRTPSPSPETQQQNLFPPASLKGICSQR